MTPKGRLAARPGAALTVLLTILLVIGCLGCPVKLKTIDLTPTSVATGTSGVSGSTGFCISAGHPPPSSFSVGNAQMMVGFDDFFKAGADPFPCDDVRAAVFRAGALFDVSPFDSIVSANLLFDTQKSVITIGIIRATQSPAKSQATKIGVGTKAFTTKMPDTNEASLPTGSSVNVGVSQQVRDWITKTVPNFGFVISGPRGLVDPQNPPKDNDAQVSWYTNLRLRVVYNPAQNPRAPQ
jgi:hypothetical protein